MSVSGERFTVGGDLLGPIESGTSLLLTGDDSDALETVFHRLVAPDADERSVVLAADLPGSAVRRSLDGARRRGGSRSYVLTGDGRSGENVETVDDIGDLTRLGMEFSSLVASSQREADRFRTGIFLCSTICAEAEDTRSVYRFLNSSFLTDIRRGEGIGVCAVDTSADIGADVDSTVTGLKTSFAAHVEVERTGPNEAELTVSGLDGADETLTVSL
ncbi:hypothetical protein KTS45_05965 [Halomicroarcula limicola]|uniref:Uncharacterized protein n=1 Tax=Haloarcula limicola TaxID=1429915 RepID=A0A8J8C6A2_9EURY|nr:hypothetical protein [Halomicroarcula limicola]MBV0923743.1 hypothetical protein [Halomicroarcula limicola]